MHPIVPDVPSEISSAHRLNTSPQATTDAEWQHDMTLGRTRVPRISEAPPPTSAPKKYVPLPFWVHAIMLILLLAALLCS